MNASQVFLNVLPGKIITTFYRRLVMVTRPLNDIPAASPNRPANLRLLTQADTEAYYRLLPHYTLGTFQARIANGEQCFAVFADDRIAHVGWASVKPNYIPYLRRDLIPRPADVILFNNYTHPHYRSHGFAKIRSDYLLQYYRAQGFSEAIGIVAFENTVGLTVARGIGFKAIGLISCLRLGPWQKIWQKAWSNVPMPKLAKPGGPRAIRGVG